MKQYIKKALWIIPFVFSLNLSATTYYFQGGTANDAANWDDGAGNNPATWTTPPAFNGTTCFSNNDIFDLNGINCDLQSCLIGDATIQNTGSSCTLSIASAKVLTIQGTLNYISSNIINNFSTSGTVTYSSGSSGQPLNDFYFYNLRLTAGAKDLSSGKTIRIKNLFQCSTTLVIKGTLQLDNSATYSSTTASTSAVLELLTGGLISDSRTTKSYPRKFIHFSSANVYPGTYNWLFIDNSVTLGGDVTTSFLDVGYTDAYVLNLSSYTLTVLSPPTMYLDPLNSPPTYTSRINAANGTLSTTFTLGTPYIWDPEMFGTSVTINSANLNNVKNLIINGTDEIGFYSNTTISNDLTLNNGSIYLDASTLTIGGQLAINTSNTSWVSKTATSKIDLTGANSKLYINNSSTTFSTSSIFKSNKISYLEINFTSGGTFLLSENFTIDKNLIGSSTTGNILNINGKTLTINGIITNSSGAAGLNFKGSSSSNLSCSTTDATFYFDQTSASSSSINTLTLSNNSKYTLGNNLTVSSLSIGTATLYPGSNTLTFGGISTQPITWSTGGSINPNNSTIKYAQTSNNGNNTLSLAAYSSNIHNLTLDFANGGTLIPDGNMTIGNNLTMSTANNYFNIDGKTLTMNGTVSMNSGAGKFIGGSTSSIVCGAAGTVYFSQSGTDNYLKNFTVNNSKTLTLGNTLNIAGGSAGNYGTVIIDTLATCSTGNNLVLKSTSGGTARIGKSPGTIVGEYKVEQYFPAERDFRFISSPVVGGTAYQWRDEGNNNSGIGTHITGASGSSNNFDASTSNKPSAFYYDETNAGNITNIYTTSTTVSDDPGWASIAGGGSSNTLDNGKGYRVLIRGDRSLSLTANPAPSANVTTLWVKGTYPNHSTSISVTNSNRKDANNRLYDNNGMNLIGNPFPSAIDWNVISRSNVDDGYVVYDRTGNSYKGWNGSTGSAGRYISANQAFFVYCNNSSGGSLTINEWDKYDGVGGSIFQEKLINHLKINLMYDSSYNSDTYLHFREDAKNTKDNFDIPQMGNNGTNVATIDESNFPYNINSMGAIDSFESIPLSVQGTPAATLKLSFFDIGSFYNHKIELVDTYKKSTTPITEGLIYTFDITTDSLSFKNGRFFLNFTKQEGMTTRIIQTSRIANIYPNPIQNDKLNIQLDNKYDKATYEIINLIGQTLTSGDINKTKSLDIREYSNGVYFLKVSSKGTTQTIQFIK